MSVDTIREILGRLQDDPHGEGDWERLAEIVKSPASAGSAELDRLLEVARARHEARREWGAVARLLELGLSFAAGSGLEPAMQAELARVYQEELFDAKRAAVAYQRLLELRPDDAAAREHVDADAERREKWKDLYDRYLTEASGSSEPPFRSVLLTSAADVAYRYGGTTIERSEILALTQEALELDSKNRRAAALSEALALEVGDFDRAAEASTLILRSSGAKDERVAGGLRAARLYAKKLDDAKRAVGVYQEVVDLSPGQPDALAYLAEAFSSSGEWDFLVALYEDQLRSGVKGEAELGIVVQLAMIHWRMRGKPEAAEPWFDRVRKSDPTHAGMLSFFRERLASKEEAARLITILTDAQRALPAGPAKNELGTEIAKLAEHASDATKAVEQYRALLRQDPANDEARDALRRIYQQTQNSQGLLDLARQKLDALSAEHPGRAGVLRDMAELHADLAKKDPTGREGQKHEQARVAILLQLAQLDEGDVESLREIVKTYEGLGRWRDLLAYQQKLAERTEDPAEKASTYRSAARRWLDQFSNVQNAIAAYEGLLEVRKADEEAIDKLRDLYQKRRAWPQLFGLFEKMLGNLEGEGEDGPKRAELLLEMAKLAAERLDRGADAVGLYRRALEIDPDASGAFEALERQAEREKDFATLADALEQRITRTSDPAARLALLQKLGTVYAERLKEPEKTITAWNRVLELSPGHQRALRVLRDAHVVAGDFEALEGLYASQDDFEGLADFLSGSADKATDPAQKIEISFRAARVYEERLRTPERAQRSYERILSTEEGHIEASRKLIPIYEKEEKWGRLPALYETLLGAAEDDAARLVLLGKLTHVTGGPLSNKAVALDWARKAYELEPDDVTLEQLEGAARGAANWAPFVDALEARLKKKKGLTNALKRTLRFRLADVYARELDRVDQAVASYRDLVETDPTDAETVRALDGLLRSTGRRDDLRWLFQLRSDQVEGDARADVLAEWAALEEDVFGDADRASDLYRRVLDLSPGRGSALRARARLLLSKGEYAEAAAIIERHRDVAEGEDRADRELELAALYVDHLDRLAEALASAKRVLEARPHASQAVALLERLVDKPETRAAAAAVLETEYAAVGDGRRQAGAIRALIETEAEPARRRELHVALTDVEEEKLSAPGTAFDVILRALNEFPSDVDLWSRAASLADKSGRPTDLAEAYRTHLVSEAAKERELPAEVELQLCERAAALHDESLGDPEGAMPYLERVLSVDPTNQRAFARLKQILTGSERWGELEELYDRAAESATDDAAKVELLHEVAVIAEDVIGDTKRAIGYYESIVGIDATHVPALDALEKLYEAEERWNDLADLLEQRLTTASDEDALDIRLYLGRIYLDRLHKPEQAIGHVEEILSLKVEDDDARELAERLLEIEGLRPRAAKILEEVYVARDQVRNLVRILDVRREVAAEDGDRRDLLRRIAELRDERLHDDGGSLDALAALVPLDPEDTSARTRLLDIGRRLGEHERVSTVLEAAAAKASAPSTRAEILMSLAGLREGPLGDVEGAEKVYRRVTEIDPGDPAIVVPAAEALARILAAAGRTKDLVGVLELHAKLEDDVEKRRALHERAGELYETSLDDPARAATAWKARLADDPADVRALGALERLYEKQEAWRDLVQTLRAREQAETDETERRRAMVRAATVLASKVDDVPEAINAWRAVLDAFGPERSTLGALAEQYARADRWTDLAETLEVELSLVEDAPGRAALLARLGDARRLHLGDQAGALEAYREALSLEPTLIAAREALGAMLENPEVRKEAAQVLQPLHEAESDANALLRVLEIQIEDADSPEIRLELLDRARATAEGPLGDADRAYGIAARGAKEAVGESSIGSWVDTVERLAATTGAWKPTVELYQAIAPEILDGDVQLRLLLRIGELARGPLGDDKLAITSYVKALEARADETRALVALDELYGRANQDAELLDILRRRADAAEGNDDERVALLFRQADLSKDKLSDPTGATETYEQILEIGIQDRAITALEALYKEAGRHADRIGLAERQLEAGRGDGADLHTRIARIAHADQGDHDRAFDELEEALRIDATFAPAIEEVESYLQEKGDGNEVKDRRARAAAMLEPVYLRRADWKDVQRALEARLDASEDPTERRELLGRLATLHEEQREDYQAALGTIARLLHEEVSDETTWAELERLARVASAEKRLAGIYAEELGKIEADDPSTAKLSRRTGELYEQLGEVEESLKFYRRAHTFEPESRDLFDRIDALLVKEKRHEERVALYRAALDDRHGGERLEALLVVAELEQKELGRKEDAVETLRSALEVDETDPRTLDRLAGLYGELAMHRDLAELLERRATLESSPEVSATHRLALARLLRDKLDDKSGAVDQLEIIVEALPRHAEAIADLEKLSHDAELKARVVDVLRPLYESADNWQLTIKLNEERLGLADHPQDKVVVLRETAALWETRGAEPNKAFEALRSAFDLDVDDGELRSDLERLAERVSTQEDKGGWSRLTDSFERAVAGGADEVVRRDILTSLARIYDQKLDDPRSALGAMQRLAALDLTDAAPLVALDPLAVLLGDWLVVVDALLKRAELASDNEAADLHRRVARTRIETLEDESGAVASYERALELDPSDPPTLDALLELYEARTEGADERLVELFARRIELLGDGDAELRYALLIKSADRLEKLGRPRDAITSLESALDARPGDAAVLARLEQLFRAESMWDALLENLKLQASGADHADRRVDLRVALGELHAKQLDDAASAVEDYRQVLEESPTEPRAIAALRRIAEEREELRLEATDILLPVVTAAGKHEDRVALLELRLLSLSDPAERAQALGTAAEVLDADLSRPADAEAALLRAIEETPDDASLHDRAVAVATKTQSFTRYADVLEARAAAALDPVLGRDLHVRHGVIAEERLEDHARAARAYAKAVDQAGDEPDLLASLDRLYVRLGDDKALADIVERRVAVSGDGEAAPKKADLLHRLAVLQLEKFKEEGAALGTLRQALEQDPAHAASRASLEGLLSRVSLFDDVVEALETVYRQQADHAALARLYKRKVEHAPLGVERLRARLELARVLEEQAKDPGAALDALLEAVAEDPTDTEVLAEIERLASSTSGFAKSADAFEAAIRARSADISPETARELWIRAAEWRRDKVSDPVAAEASFREALALDAGNDVVLRAIAELQRASGRERDLVVTLRALAKLEGPQAAADLRREAKALAEGPLTDTALTEEVLREMLAADDSDAWALAELTLVRERAEDHAEVFKLLVRRSEIEADGKIVRDLRHRAAIVARDNLKDAPAAIGLFEQIFEDQPSDEIASTALRDLYEKEKREKDLLKLLERLVDQADGAAARAALRVDAARISDAIGSDSEAIDILRAVLDDDPAHEAASLHLSRMFEKTSRDDELAELLAKQIELAAGRGDAAAELRFRVRLGEVQETRLGSAEKAIETYRAILERDDKHDGALLALARLYESRGERGEAAKVLERVLERATGDEAVAYALRLADVFAAIGEGETDVLAGQRRALERGLEARRSASDVRDRLRAVYEKLQTWPELADLIAEDARAAEDVAAKVRLLRAAADIHQTKREDAGAAAKLLAEASELAPQDRDLLLALCDAYSASGRGKDAIEVLQKIVESYGGRRSKDLAVIHHRIAKAHLAEGEREKALAELDVAFKIDPGSVAVLRDLGVLALDLADVSTDDKARDQYVDRASKTFLALLLQKLDASSPISKAEVFYYLGDVSRRQGDSKKAIQMLERALDNDKNMERARTLLATVKG